MSASAVHLVRHGEVENPHHVVYADLPGYGLSSLGFDQASAAAGHLTARPIAAVVSSPLLRARQTASAIAAAHGIDVVIDEALTEWAGGTRWAGVRWEDLDTVFPGELTQYLERPLDITFASETIAQCGARFAAAVATWAANVTGGELVFVGHQDPVHAGSLTLTGRLPAAGELRYHADKPNHASVTTLEPAGRLWRQSAYWEPDQGEEFPPLE